MPKGHAPPTGAAVLLYAGLAVASTWPLLTHLGSHLPLHRDALATVPLAMTWALSWTAHWLGAGAGSYWDAPIFHPMQGSFGLSEAMPLPGLIGTPLALLGASPAAVHNCIVLLALFSNGWFAYRLLRSLRLHPSAALWGGATMLMIPMLQRAIGVVTLVPLAGILITLHGVVAFEDSPRLRHGIQIGLGVAVTYLCCGQYGLFMLLVLPPSCLWLVHRHHFRRRALLALAAGALLAASLVGPVALGQHAALSSHHSRSDSTARSGSASYAQWTRLPWSQRLPLPGLVEEGAAFKNKTLFPGTAVCVLGLFGLGWALRRRPHRRLAATLWSLLLLGILMSTLPRLGTPGAVATSWLRDSLPGFAQQRAIWRFAVFPQVCLVLGVAFTLHALHMHGRRSQLAGLLALALGLVTTFEVWPAQRKLTEVAEPDQWQGFTSWVRDNVDADHALVHLPLAPDLGSFGLESEARWMYLAIFHQRPILNGYSSYFPGDYRRARKACRSFPAHACTKRLRKMRVAYVAVEQDWLRHTDRKGLISKWPLIFSLGKQQLDVYRIPP